MSRESLCAKGRSGEHGERSAELRGVRPLVAPPSSAFPSPAFLPSQAGGGLGRRVLSSDTCTARTGFITTAGGAAFSEIAPGREKRPLHDEEDVLSGATPSKVVSADPSSMQVELVAAQSVALVDIDAKDQLSIAVNCAVITSMKFSSSDQLIAWLGSCK
jgi:hypothetical protein